MLVSDKDRLTNSGEHAGITVLIMLGLLACCIASQSPLAGIASMGLFGWFLFREVIVSPHKIVKYLPLYFGAAANIAGCAACEYADIYLAELQLAADFSGSLPLLVFSHWVFFQAMKLYDSKWGIEDAIGSDKLRAIMFIDAATMAVLASLVAIFVVIAPNPSFTLGFDRFSYALTMPTVLRKLWDWMSFLMLFPILAIKENRSKAGMAAIAFYVLCGIWTGSKFGAFFNLICLAALAYYDKLIAFGGKRLTKTLFVTAIAIVVLIIGAAAINNAISTSGRTTTQYLEQRMAQQGQLWWATYSNTNGEAHLEQIPIELAGTFAPTDISSNIGSRYGIYGIMYLNAPASVIDAKLAGGSRYTESGFATWYYCLGPLGPVLLALAMGFLIAFAYNILIRAIITGRAVEAALLCKITQTLRVVYSMGTLATLFAPLSISVLALLFFLYLANCHQRTKGGKAPTGPSRVDAIYVLPSSGLINRQLDQLLLDAAKSKPRIVRVTEAPLIYSHRGRRYD